MRTTVLTISIVLQVYMCVGKTEYIAEVSMK
jgi:hypothetical protein